MAKSKRSQHGSQQTGQRPGSANNASRASGQARPSGQSAQARVAQSTQNTRAGQTTAATKAVTKATRPTNGTSESTRTESATSNRYRPLSTRETPKHGAQRRKQAQQPWWQKNMTTLIAVGSVVVLIAIFFGIAHFAGGSTPTGVGSPASAQLLQPLEHPNASIFADVGSGGVPNPFKRVGGSDGNGGDFLKGSNGKPEFLYAGAEYCPYCAAERWSMIMALSRFGSFDGLKLMASGDAPEAYPDTSTFTFVDASYKSDTIDFSSVELQTRTDQTLQTPTAQQGQIMSRYNSSQYFGQSAGGIPFLSVANQYIANGAGYNPGILDNLTWDQISGKLGNSKDPVTQDIVGNANWITAAICQTTSQSPASVCKSKPITDLEKQL